MTKRMADPRADGWGGTTKKTARRSSGLACDDDVTRTDVPAFAK